MLPGIDDSGNTLQRYKGREGPAGTRVGADDAALLLAAVVRGGLERHAADDRRARPRAARHLSLEPASALPNPESFMKSV